MRRIILFIIITGIYFCNGIFAQVNKIYTPLEIQQAIKNNTRSIDGKPGRKYWHNKAEYKIEVEIDTSKRTLNGTEEIKYFNNSPDTLKQIIIRLYPDLYKKGNARDWDLDVKEIGDGTNITSLAINGIQQNKIDTLSRQTTNLIIPLNEKLMPGGSIQFKINWNYKFQTVFPYKEGIYSDNSYFVAYWYPQIAVYDDIDKWDDFYYKGVIDHYTDFSDYDVSITVPKEYVVWATGLLQNPEEVLSKNYLDKYLSALKSDEIVSVINAQDRKAGGITIQKEKNIWHFKTDNVPDFVFGTSAVHLWDLTSLIVDKKTGRRSIIGTAFKENTRFQFNITGMAKKTIDFLSTELPGVPYPFPSFTVFEGSGACEFPMMTNVGPYSGEWLNIHSLSHEITHSYFPFYMGFNERKYACMDKD